MTSPAVMKGVLEHAVKQSELWGEDQELSFPLITKSGTNQYGKTIRYYFNYSDSSQSFHYPYREGNELLTNQLVKNREVVDLEPWSFKVIEEIQVI
jgi:beta-galactosidase